MELWSYGTMEIWKRQSEIKIQIKYIKIRLDSKCRVTDPLIKNIERYVLTFIRFQQCFYTFPVVHVRLEKLLWYYQQRQIFSITMYIFIYAYIYIYVYKYFIWQSLHAFLLHQNIFLYYITDNPTAFYSHFISNTYFKINKYL